MPDEFDGDGLPWSRFVILALPRTGTNYLRTMMSQHPNIIASGELLNPKERAWDPVPSAEATCAELLRFAYRDFPNPARKSDIRTVGFKLLDWQASSSAGRPEFLDRLAGDRTVKVLHLTRDNLLECLRSHEQGRQTGRWVAFRREDLAEVPTVHLTRQMCLDFFRRAERFTTMVRDKFAHHQVLSLTYERIVADPAGELGGVHDFLGVPAREVAPSHILKQEQRPLHEVVENFTELSAEFRSTPYARFFR